MDEERPADKPDIQSVNAKIGALERRLEWVESRANDPTRKQATRDWDREEARALRAGLDALRFYRQEADDEARALDLCRDLVAALDEHSDGDVLVQVIARLRELVEATT